MHPTRRHRQIAGKPTAQSTTKRLADQAPAAGVTTLGMVTASIADRPVPWRRAEVGHPQPSPHPGGAPSGAGMPFTD